MTLLSVRDLKVWFPIEKGLMRRVVGHVRAVDGVSFEVSSGETLALVGESGCGKTTVGRSILQLIPPTSGEVRFLGEDLGALDAKKLRQVRRHAAMVFQDPMTALNPRLRVIDIVAEGIDQFGLAENQEAREERVVELLLRVQLGREHLMRYPHEFSGGQRQRIGIARALAVEPKLIICDEAVSALDLSIQAQVLNLLGDLQSELHIAYLFITHDLAVVRHIADRVLVMYLGVVVEEGPSEAIFAEPLHPYTQALLASAPSLERGTNPPPALEGDVPSPAHPPSGCRFHTRCPIRVARCQVEVPEPRKVRLQTVACHLVEPMAEPDFSS